MTTSKIKILVSDDVSETGLKPFREAGFKVEKHIGLKPDELCSLISDYDGLVVRSETKVTDRVMDAAKRLRAIGRAGVGVDNIDVAAAATRGIVVMNAPDGNTITTAEHSFAMLLALARKIPLAFTSLRAAKWERKKFVGVELYGKTLGIIGLGRIGRTVARIAMGFNMRVIAYDPFVTPESTRDLELEILPIEEIFKRSDFISLHTPLTSETRGILGAQAFSLMKRGVRIINCARGGLVDETALYHAIKEGIVAGAAIDVFEQEPPPPDLPLLSLDEVIMTPHLGASTTEAQEGVAVTVAEQMRDYFMTGALRGAVNAPSLGAHELSVLAPYITLAEKLGRVQAQLIEGPVREVRLDCAGELAELNSAPVSRAFLAGFLSNTSDRVNVVNSFLIAEERGVSVTTSSKRSSAEYIHSIQTTVATSTGQSSVAGALFGLEREGRITEIDGFRLEAIPAGHMLILYNKDLPGVIGKIGTVLGDGGVNIGRFHLGRRARPGEAIAVIEVDVPIEEKTLERLRSLKDIISAHSIKI